MLVYCCSTDEDARQAMMLDGGKIKEIQVKLLLSSRSEMHKVIETARQSVPILTLTAPAPSPAPTPAPVPVAAQPAPAPTPAPVAAPPAITPFSAALGAMPLTSFGIPGIGNPHEIPQPAVIEPPAPLISPSAATPNHDDDNNVEDRNDRKATKEKEKRRSRTRSRSRDRDRKDRKRDRRDRSRSRERRRRDRSRSRDRRDRKRDRKDRSRSRDRSPGKRSRDRRRSPRDSQEKSLDLNEPPAISMAAVYGVGAVQQPPLVVQPGVAPLNSPALNMNSAQHRFTDPSMMEAFSKLQELGKKRNPNAFQGEQTNGAPRFPAARGGAAAGIALARGGGFRREGRVSRFDDQQQGCCVAIRSAPNHTSYGDVRRFFPYLIDKHGIKMINDNTGRRTGNIYVRFCDSRSKQLALQRRTNELKGAIVEVEDLDDGTYDSAVDSFLPYRDDNDDEDVSLVIADRRPASPARASYSVLKLADLPHFVKEHDIMKAFSDFSLLSITLNDCRMSRSKIAYVQFVKSEDAKLAYERKDVYVFGRRQPVITTVSDDEYEKVKLEQGDKAPEPAELQEEANAPRDPRQRRQHVDSPRPQGAPLLHAQPSVQFFPNAPFVPQQNFGAPFPGAQFGGFPNAVAMDPRAAAAGWAGRPGFPNSSEQMPHMTHKNPRVLSTDMDEQPLDCVLMKGLPTEATDRTIVTFLSDTGAVPARIHLMLDTSGVPSGDCFCEFRSVQEARLAATKHGHDLDGCRVTVDLVSRKVVKEALEGPKPGEGLMPTPMQQPFYEHQRGGFSQRPFRGRGGFDRGGYDRGGYRGGFERGGYRGRAHWAERGGGRGFDRGRGRGFGRGRGGYMENGAREHPAELEESDPALEGFGAPGCVLSMENVPFRASVEDILAFFGDFEMTQDDVIRRYNERGQPTGDARVAFRSPHDAQRALAALQMQTIHDRRISLTLL